VAASPKQCGSGDQVSLVESRGIPCGFVDLNAFAERRPFAYHTTAAPNLMRLRATMAIERASRLFGLAKRPSTGAHRDRRKRGVTLKLDGWEVIVRDQRPLVAGAIEFEAGWDLARLIEHLNAFTFFWPGTLSGPIRSGCSHFDRYSAAGESLAVLRAPARALFQANAPRLPLVSRCNSGSARMNAGRKVPRGSKTFVLASVYDGTPVTVKEIVYESVAILPANTEFAPTLEGPWRQLAP
jgi:hypothetical protein